MVFQQKVNEKEAKLKQSEEEVRQLAANFLDCHVLTLVVQLYARHREMKEALEKQRNELEDKKRRIESGRPLTPDKKSKKGFLRT